MKHLILFFLLVSSSFSFGQLEQKSQIRLTLLPLGIDTETALSDEMSINLDSGLQPFGYAYFSTDDSVEEDSYFGLMPILQASVRNYYNFSKREEKGKKISGNSANYVALLVRYAGKPTVGSDDRYDDLTILTFGGVWGIQRTYDSNIYLDLNMGLGNIIAKGEPLGTKIDGIGIVSSFAIGYAFGQN